MDRDKGAHLVVTDILHTLHVLVVAMLYALVKIHQSLHKNGYILLNIDSVSAGLAQKQH